MWTAGHNGFTSFWADDSGCFVCYPSEDGWELWDSEGVIWRGCLPECFAAGNRILGSLGRIDS